MHGQGTHGLELGQRIDPVEANGLRGRDISEGRLCMLGLESPRASRQTAHQHKHQTLHVPPRLPSASYAAIP
jgi:hypothetical protein